MWSSLRRSKITFFYNGQAHSADRLATWNTLPLHLRINKKNSITITYAFGNDKLFYVILLAWNTPR